jgi:hypothetical protein
MLPGPTDPWLSAPGFAFARSISSRIVRAGDWLLTISTGATALTIVIGANAFAVS